MDDPQTQERDAEQEWILKYRAALDAVPAREPWGHKVGARLQESVKNFTAGAARILAEWIEAGVRKVKRIVKTGVELKPPLKPSPMNIRSKQSGEEVPRRVG